MLTCVSSTHAGGWPCNGLRTKFASRFCGYSTCFKPVSCCCKTICFDHTLQQQVNASIQSSPYAVSCCCQSPAYPHPLGDTSCCIDKEMHCTAFTGARFHCKELCGWYSKRPAYGCSTSTTMRSSAAEWQSSVLATLRLLLMQTYMLQLDLLLHAPAAQQRWLHRQSRRSC